MSSTRGSKRLELPAAFGLQLEGLEFVSLSAADGETFHAYRHKRHPLLLVHAAASNIPGDTDTVLLTVPGILPASRLRVDDAGRRLAALVAVRDGRNVLAS